MTLYHGKGKTDDSMMTVDEGIFGTAFVLYSDKKDAGIAGGEIETYEVSRDRLAGLKMVQIKTALGVREYLRDPDKEADIIIYPYMSQCSVPQFMAAFMTGKAAEALTLVKE